MEKRLKLMLALLILITATNLASLLSRPHTDSEALMFQTILLLLCGTMIWTLCRK